MADYRHSARREGRFQFYLGKTQYSDHIDRIGPYNDDPFLQFGEENLGHRDNFGLSRVNFRSFCKLRPVDRKEDRLSRYLEYGIRFSARAGFYQYNEKEQLQATDIVGSAHMVDKFTIRNDPSKEIFLFLGKIQKLGKKRNKSVKVCSHTVVVSFSDNPDLTKAFKIGARSRRRHIRVNDDAGEHFTIGKVPINVEVSSFIQFSHYFKKYHQKTKIYGSKHVIGFQWREK